MSFDNVADHLVDYADRHPELADVVDDLAAFLARVQDVSHDHEEDPDRGLESSSAERLVDGGGRA